MAARRLYRKRDDKMIAGVMSGLGEYLNVDASIVRIVYAAVAFFTGIVPGIIVYLLMVIIIPVEPETPD